MQRMCPIQLRTVKNCSVCKHYLQYHDFVMPFFTLNNVQHDFVRFLFHNGNINGVDKAKLNSLLRIVFK